MYKKIASVLFVMGVYLLSITHILASSEDPGFYSEYGRDDYIAHLRGLPHEERELRVQYWSTHLVANALKASWPITKYNMELAIAGNNARGMSMYNSIIRDNLEKDRAIFDVRLPTTTADINKRLRALAEQTKETKGGDLMTIGLEFESDAPGSKKHKFPALDTLMYEALTISLTDIRGKLDRF